MSDFEARPFELTAKDTEGKVKEVAVLLTAVHTAIVCECPGLWKRHTVSLPD